MKNTNSALNLLSAIGGTAERMAIVAQLGWQPNRKPRARQNPAGTKLAQRAEAGMLTCRNGAPIHRPGLFA